MTSRLATPRSSWWRLGSKSPHHCHHLLPPARWQAYEGDKLLTPINAVPFVDGWTGPPHVIFGHDSKRDLQLARHATGIDTGCVGGGRLTAAVLPPLRELRRSEVFARKIAAGEALTFEDLQGRIVSVRSQQADA